MTTAELVTLIAAGREIEFYTGGEWKRLAEQVRAMDRHECQLCKARGRYCKGVIVHHVLHLKDRPDLAMSIYNPDTKERQLITVCKVCHEQLHPEALTAPKTINKPEITAERWD